MLSASTAWRRRCWNWWSVIMISRPLLWMLPNRCHVFAVPLCTWRLWAYGSLHMAPVGLLGILSTRALQMPVILLVCLECSVGGWFLSRRTGELFLCLCFHTLYICCRLVIASGFYIETCYATYLCMPHGLFMIKHNEKRSDYGVSTLLFGKLPVFHWLKFLSCNSVRLTGCWGRGF